jgi:hypothetical protein
MPVEAPAEPQNAPSAEPAHGPTADTDEPPAPKGSAHLPTTAGPALRAEPAEPKKPVEPVTKVNDDDDWGPPRIERDLLAYVDSAIGWFDHPRRGDVLRISLEIRRDGRRADPVFFDHVEVGWGEPPEPEEKPGHEPEENPEDEPDADSDSDHEIEAETEPPRSVPVVRRYQPPPVRRPDEKAAIDDDSEAQLNNRKQHI